VQVTASSHTTGCAAAPASTASTANTLSQPSKKARTKGKATSKGGGKSAGNKKSIQKNSNPISSPQTFEPERKIFYNFLVSLSREVDQDWPRFKEFVRNARVHGSNNNAQIASIMLENCKTALQLLKRRKEERLEEKKLNHNTNIGGLLNESSKFIHMDIIFLKQGCERGIRDLQQVCLISQDEIFQMEMNNLRKILHRSTEFEKVIANARSQIQKLLTESLVTRVVTSHVSVPKNGTNGVKKSGGPGKTKKRGATSTNKVSNGKRRKSGASGANGASGNGKKNSASPKGSKKISLAYGGMGDEGSSKKSNGPNVTIVDSHPDRLTNSLLEIPQGSMTGEPTLPVSEFLKLMEIYLPEPDTFPLSYYGKLLGIELSVITNNIEKPNDDEWTRIPELGNYGRELTRLNNETLESIDADGSRSNRANDNVDPTWQAILNEYRGYRDDDLKQASEMNKPCLISENCLSLARKLNIVGHDVRFRTATMNDVNNICTINEVRVYCEMFCIY